MAEAGRRRPPAVDRHEKQPLAPGLVRLVHISAAEEHAVLHGEGREVAAADAEHGEVWSRFGPRSLGPRPEFAGERGQRLPRGKQEVLERVRAHHVVERARGGIMAQPVGAAILLVEPAGRQVGDRGQVSKHDRSVGNLGPHHAVPRPPQGIDQLLQP